MLNGALRTVGMWATLGMLAVYFAGARLISDHTGLGRGIGRVERAIAVGQGRQVLPVIGGVDQVRILEPGGQGVRHPMDLQVIGMPVQSVHVVADHRVDPSRHQARQ